MTRKILCGLFYGVLPVALLWFCLAKTGRADNYQCTDPDGCLAMMPGHDPDGLGPKKQGPTKTVKFKKGDIVSTGSGWIVNPHAGWSPVDFNTTAAGLLPFHTP